MTAAAEQEQAPVSPIKVGGAQAAAPPDSPLSLDSCERLASGRGRGWLRAFALRKEEVG